MLGGFSLGLNMTLLLRQKRAGSVGLAQEASGQEPLHVAAAIGNQVNQHVSVESLVDDPIRFVKDLPVIVNT